MKTIREELHGSLEELGSDEPAWTTKLVRRHLEEAPDVEYSIPSCRGILEVARLSHQKPRPANAEAEPQQRGEYGQSQKKRGRGNGRQRSPYRSDENLGQWRSDSSLVRAKFASKRGIVGPPQLDVLARSSHWGRRLLVLTISRVPHRRHAKHIILTLYEAFVEELIVIPDGASYFRASAGTDLAERNVLAFVRLPAYRPDLDPVEACWRQRDSALGNRYVESINALTARINGTLDQLSLPEVCSFF